MIAVAIAVVGLVGCSSGTAGSAAPTTAPRATAAAPTTAALSVGEQWFLETVSSAPGMDPNAEPIEIVRLGHTICSDIGVDGVTRESLVANVARSPWGPTAAPVLVEAAHMKLCRNKSFAVPLPPPPPPAPVGPKTTITGDGTYEVGVDVEPGKYKAPGSAQGSLAPCYWARLKADGEDIIDNDLGNGPKTATIKKGELFETARCGTWTKS